MLGLCGPSGLMSSRRLGALSLRHRVFIGVCHVQGSEKGLNPDPLNVSSTISTKILYNSVRIHLPRALTFGVYSISRRPFSLIRPRGWVWGGRTTVSSVTQIVIGRNNTHSADSEGKTFP